MELVPLACEDAENVDEARAKIDNKTISAFLLQ